jgi:hypothetical protein
MMPTRRAIGALCAIALAALVGCGHGSAPSEIPGKLLGTWYDDRSGEEYRFISDTLVVIPHAQAGGGNAATYRLVGTSTLDITSAGAHHVSVVESVGPEVLTLADPLSGFRQRLCRHVSQTQRARSLEASALVAVSDFATLAPEPEIVWATKKPAGKGTEWTDWAPSTLSAYASAWDWTVLKRDGSPILVSGDGETAGYAFTFVRTPPSARKLEELRADASIEATRGLARIDVGYSASKAQYPPGTLVYLPGGLIYTLGDGFALRVGLDRKHESFMPLTHR